MLHILFGLLIIVIIVYFYLQKSDFMNTPYDTKKDKISENSSNIKLKFDNQRQNIQLHYRQSKQQDKTNTNTNTLLNSNSFLHSKHYVPSSLLHMYKTDDIQPIQPFSSVFYNDYYPIHLKVNIKGKVMNKKTFFKEKSLNDT